MRKILLSFIAVCGTLLTYGQQSAQYTQYMVNPYLMNPALASVEDMIDIKAGYRKQWSGFQTLDPSVGAPGSPAVSDGRTPETMYISAHTPIGKPHAIMHYVTEAKSWFGFGGKIINDQAGYTSLRSLMLSGTYNMAIIKPRGSGIYTKGGLRMSFGMFVGIRQYQVDWSGLVFGSADRLAGGQVTGRNIGSRSDFEPDASVGVWIYNEKFFIGGAMDQILGNELNVNTSGLPNGLTVSDITPPRLVRHAFLTAGYTIKINDDLGWTPSILMKSLTNIGSGKYAMDFNNRITYDDSYWGGISYRHLDAISIAVGAVITYNYEVAYSYDYTTTDIRSIGGASATHEITLGYRIKPKPTAMNAEDHNWGHSGHFKKGKYKGR